MFWIERLNHWKANHNLYPKKILDVGACIGHFYDIAKSIWPESEIVMIEANSNCESAIKNKNSRYYITALSDKIGQRCFYKNNEAISSGESFYKENTIHYNDEVLDPLTVNTNTLDSLLKDEIFDFIKIDTQGSEIDILKGGSFLVKKADYILLEVSITEYNIGAPLIKDVLNYMDSINFTMVDIWNCAYANREKGKHFDDLCQVDILFKRL